jgi:Ca2+-dependent lipid-binding protein
MIRIQLSARNLDKKDFFGKSDPFFVIHQSREGQLVPVCKSEVIKKNLNPEWKPINTTAQILCNGDFDREIIIEVLDWNSNGSHEKIGECSVSK